MFLESPFKTCPSWTRHWNFGRKGCVLLSKKAEKVFLWKRGKWCTKKSKWLQSVLWKLVFDIDNSNIWFCRVETEGESFSAQGEISQLTSGMLHAVVIIFSHPLEVPRSSMIQVWLSTRWVVELLWWAEPLPQDVSDPVQVLGTSKDLVQALELQFEPTLLTKCTSHLIPLTPKSWLWTLPWSR